MWTHGDIEPVLAACIQLTPRQTVLCDYVIEAVCVVFSLTLETIDMKQTKKCDTEDFYPTYIFRLSCEKYPPFPGKVTEVSCTVPT